MLNNLPTLYLVLAGVIGLLVGLLISTLFSRGEALHVKGKLPPADMLKEGFADEARLWYSPAGKRIITELDGEYYRDIKNLSREQIKRLTNLVELWGNWLKGEKPQEQGKETALVFPLPTSPEPVEQPQAFHAQQVINEPTEYFSEKAAEDDFSDILAELSDTKTETEDGTVLPFHLPDDEKLAAEEDLFADLSKSFGLEEPVTPKSVPLAPLSVTDQVSVILERLLLGSELKSKGIKLLENQAHGVDVWVGLEKFNGIDQVPYPEVKELIKEAVHIWEKESGN